jgi:plastocyanin
VPGDAFTLKPESLDRTLRNVTYRSEHFIAWKSWDKVAAFNTVEEFSRLKEYGNGVAAFIEEGELPAEDDASYERDFDVVKFMGTTRRVTHVMQQVRTHIGSVVAQETVNGTMWLLRQVEKALFYADANLVPQEFNGLFTLIRDNAPAANIIDLRGKPFSQDHIEEGAHIVRSSPNYGMATDLYMSDGAYSDLARLFYPTQRSEIPNPSDGMVGFTVNGMRTQAGPIRFRPDVFIEPGAAPNASGVGDIAKRPGVPTVSVGAAAADAASQFLAADAGDYIYKVVARNRFGLSVPVTSAAVTVAAGDKVTFTITDGSPLASCYVIYRTAADGAAATATEITQVKRTGATTTYVDRNENLPGCTQAALIQGNKDNLVIKQLAPFTRIPLATIDTSMRWAQVLYMVLTLISPNKNILFKNVGRLTGTKVPSI